MLQPMIRHSFAEREVGSWLPTETAQTRSCSWRLNPDKAKCPIPPRAPAGRGNMSTLCALGCLAMAGFCRDAFPGGNPWQDFVAMRSRAAIRGNILARCVPGRLAVAIFSPYASQKGPRTGKAPLPGNISPPCIQNELALARYARHVSEKPCKSPPEDTPREHLAREGPFSLHRPLESCTARESCHPASTNRPGTRNPCAAEQREPPATTASPSWRGSLRNAPPDTAPNRPNTRNLGAAERRQTAHNRYAEAQLESQRHGLAALC